MKKAFAIGCWMPQHWHELQLFYLIKSIRLVGHKEDIFVLTVDPSLKDRIGERDWKVLRFREVSYPAIDNSSLTKRSCAQKLHYWRLPEQYDKVVALDTDILFHHNGSQLFDLPATTGFPPSFKPDSDVLRGMPPISFGHFVYRPNIGIFNDILEVIKGGFFVENGWGDYGGFEWRNKIQDWSFFCGNASQGYLYYYFALLKKSLNKDNAFDECFIHYHGIRNKGSVPQKRKYKRDMLKLIPM